MLKLYTASGLPTPLSLYARSKANLMWRMQHGLMGRCLGDLASYSIHANKAA